DPRARGVGRLPASSLGAELHQQPSVEVVGIGLTLLDCAEARLLPRGNCAAIPQIRVDSYPAPAAVVEQPLSKSAGCVGADSASARVRKEEHVEAAEVGGVAD